jgi:hypothetical protein
MKYVIGLIMALCFFDAGASEIKVSKMTTVSGMNYKFQLKTSLQEKVILDCQSFVQGLTIGEGSSPSFFLIEPEDCEAITERMQSSLKKHEMHCLDVEDTIRSDYTCH